MARATVGPWRVIPVGLVLVCGCDDPSRPNTALWPSAARDPKQGQFWRPTAVEKSRAEELGRWYAVRRLEVTPAQLAKLRTGFMGLFDKGRTILHTKFYNPASFKVGPSGVPPSVLGGFPDYFTVDVDVGDWRVVDHYAEPI